MKSNFANFDPKLPSMPSHLLYPKLPDYEVFIQRARRVWSKVERAKEIIARETNDETNDEINSILNDVIRMSNTYRVSDLKKEYSLDRSPVIALQRYKDSNPSEKMKEKEWAEYFAVLALHLLDRWITRYEDMKKTPRLKMPQYFDEKEKQKMDSEFSQEIRKAINAAELLLGVSKLGSDKASNAASKRHGNTNAVIAKLEAFYFANKEKYKTKSHLFTAFDNTLAEEEKALYGDIEGRRKAYYSATLRFEKFGFNARDTQGTL